MLDLGQSEDQSRQDWPLLSEVHFTRTSPVDSRYNCVAWAAAVTTRPWWPWTVPYYWPPEAPKEETVAAFGIAYQTLNYAVCEDGEQEEGFEKIVIYTDAGQVPTHVARQLEDGRWTSKLGDLKDIEHQSPQDLAGGIYGSPVLFM